MLDQLNLNRDPQNADLSHAISQSSSPDKTRVFVVPLDQVGLSDLAQVGGKNASLGEMLQQLVPQGIRVPGGFAVTAAAYRYFLASA
ncbi:MAG: PEP/pyruvate-binding domain-containing protein, partial [Cyanophyceae cyanobacterium]